MALLEMIFFLCSWRARCLADCLPLPLGAWEALDLRHFLDNIQHQRYHMPHVRKNPRCICCMRIFRTSRAAIFDKSFVLNFPPFFNSTIYCSPTFVCWKFVNLGALRKKNNSLGRILVCNESQHTIPPVEFALRSARCWVLTIGRTRFVCRFTSSSVHFSPWHSAVGSFSVLHWTTGSCPRPSQKPRPSSRSSTVEPCLGKMTLARIWCRYSRSTFFQILFYKNEQMELHGWTRAIFSRLLLARISESTIQSSLVLKVARWPPRAEHSCLWKQEETLLSTYQRLYLGKRLPFAPRNSCCQLRPRRTCRWTSVRRTSRAR